MSRNHQLLRMRRRRSRRRAGDKAFQKRFRTFMRNALSRPSAGPCECLEDGHRPYPRRGSTISLDGQDIGEVQEITLPRMTQEMIDVTRDPAFTGMPDDHREYVRGLKRVSPMTFTVNFDGREFLKP